MAKEDKDPNIGSGELPGDKGGAAGYVDYTNIFDSRTPTANLTTIAGKVTAFNRMKTNSTISGILLAFLSICQTVKHSTNENSDDPDRDRAKERAMFLSQCLEDMQIPFSDVRGEMLDMVAMGFRVMVPQFKMRSGPNKELGFNSKYNDGKIGWKTFTPIDPTPIHSWVGPEDTGFTGLTAINQRTSTMGKFVTIPRNRFMIFRTVSNNNSPIGKSILEGAYLDYLDLVSANKIQMTGLRRSLVGIPFCRIHTKLAKDAENSQANASAINAAKKAVSDLNSEKDNAFFMPADTDEHGNFLLTVGLMGASEGGGNTRIQDAKVVIDSKEQTIARSMLAQFMTIQGKGGSYALSKTQSEVFINSLKMYLKQIEDVMNNEAIPRLFAANGEGIKKGDHYLPTLSFSDFIKDDVSEFFTAMQQSIESGIFEVTPQVQRKAGQVLGLDISEQEDLLEKRIARREEMVNSATDSAEGNGDSPQAEGGANDVPVTKAEDITDEGLLDVMNS